MPSPPVMATRVPRVAPAAMMIRAARARAVMPVRPVVRVPSGGMTAVMNVATTGAMIAVLAPARTGAGLNAAAR